MMSNNNNSKFDLNRLYNEKYVTAEAEAAKKTIYQKVDDLQKTQHRHDKYLIR